MFLAIDGDSTGRYIEKMILDNELEELTRFSLKLQRTISDFCKYIIQNSGNIIMAGGDNILAEIPSSSYCEILRGLEAISIEDYSFSIAVSISLQGAYWGLKYVKATKIKMVEVRVLDNGKLQFVNICNTFALDR